MAAAQWKATIRLPRSTFPTRPLPSLRPLYLRRCTDDLYAWQQQRPQRPSTSDAPPTFVLHDGPPYANGSLHIGHALNKILKDITCRYQLLRGRRVDYRPGWDCHGLPIELKALEEYRRATARGDAYGDGESTALTAVQVRTAARRLALATVEEQKAGFREWAVMADWAHAWMTMDPGFELRQLEVFKSMVAKGLVYRKFKPVYWSPSSRTALAEAELEYEPQHVSTAAFVKFPLFKLPEALSGHLEVGDRPVSVVIWTTTPWTLLANRVVAVHAGLDYILAKSDTYGLLLLAEPRFEALKQAISEKEILKAVATLPGSSLVGCTYQLPGRGSDEPRPIVHGDFVDAGSGTGIVHMAPGHGMDDYKLCLEHGIEPFAPIDDDGRFTAEACLALPGRFQGQEVLGEGNGLVLQLYKDAGLLLAKHKHVHNYPYDWRSKKPVITRATQQWFADVGSIRDAALSALDGVKFVPPAGRDRLASFLRHRSEWCISRQRAWGVPIPALYRKSDGAAVMTPGTIEHIVGVIRERGTDAWWSDAEAEAAWIPPSLGGPAEFVRGKDTMDVWFDSGTSWNELGAGGSSDRQAQADVYLEGSDQHRGWFQSSLLTKIATQSSVDGTSLVVAPFKTLVTHGFTLDEKGRKMSKSEGNVVAPAQIMDYSHQGSAKRQKKGQSVPEPGGGAGPDALRLWVGGCDFTKDVVVGDTVVASVVQSLLKLRNTFKFLLGALDDYTPAAVDFTTLGAIDRMALIQLDALTTSAHDAYESFQYHRVVAELHQYVATDLSATYFRYIKDRLYVNSALSLSRLHAQTVLWEVLQGLLRIASPLVPVLVEEVCDHLTTPLRFHPVTLPDAQRTVQGTWRDHNLQRDMEILLAVKTQAEALMELARAERGVGSSLQFFVVVEMTKQDDKDKSASSVALTSQPNGEARDESLGALAGRLRDLEDMLVVSRVAMCQLGQWPEDLAAAAPWRYSRPCRGGSAEVTVHVHEAPLKKCERCWKYTVPAEAAVEAALCTRCVTVLDGMRDEVPGLFDGTPKIDDAARQTKTS